MSIEKLDSIKVKQEKIAFTIHRNYVLQNITDVTALAIWCYLTSLPDDWNVHRNQLANHFQIGRDKLANALKFLNECHLIEYVPIKNHKGQIEVWQILVKEGQEFELLHKSRLIHKNESTPLKNHSLENHSSGNPHLQKKEDTKEIKNIKKSFCPTPPKSQSDWKTENAKVHSFAESKNQVASNNQVSSTVKFWGPGHPSWDSLYGDKRKTS
jgi:hypothetical protein